MSLNRFWLEILPLVIMACAAFMAFWGLALGRIPSTKSFPVTLSLGTGIARSRREVEEDLGHELVGWVARVLGVAYVVVAGLALFRPVIAGVGLCVLLILGWWLAPRIGVPPQSRG